MVRNCKRTKFKPKIKKRTWQKC